MVESSYTQILEQPISDQDGAADMSIEVTDFSTGVDFRTQQLDPGLEFGCLGCNWAFKCVFVVLESF